MHEDAVQSYNYKNIQRRIKLLNVLILMEYRLNNPVAYTAN